MDHTATFALALQSMNGVGRVTASRLLRAFRTYEALAGFPREQVLLRIKRTPNAGAIVAALFDRSSMETLLCAASEELDSLRSKGIHVLSAFAANWPVSLDSLPPASRPLLLYAYGQIEVPRSDFVSVYCGDSREADLVRALLDRILNRGYAPLITSSAAALPMPSGGGAMALVLPMGLGKAPADLRPVMLEIVRRGGLLLSPFPMQHGPYRHDEREASLLMAALARACALVRCASSLPALAGADWAEGAGRIVCALQTEAALLPRNAVMMETESDLDAVLTDLSQT